MAAAAAAAPAEGGRRCVGCGSPVAALFVQYSPGNIRLMKCDRCNSVADPYIECEFMIILIDLILHKTKAYRHMLFNVLNIESGNNKELLWKSCLAYFLLDSFKISLSESNKYDWESSRSLISVMCTCGKVLMDAFLGNFIYMLTLGLGMRYILKMSFNPTRYKAALLSIIISSYFKLFLLTMTVWEFPLPVIFIVDLLVLSSNVISWRVLTEQHMLRCFIACFAAHSVKFATNYVVLNLH